MSTLKPSRTNTILRQYLLIALICLIPNAALAYSEDLREPAYDDSIQDSHSTLHFEMVQTLAAAAGFIDARENTAMYDATRIAQASSGADTFPTEELGQMTCSALMTATTDRQGNVTFPINTTANIYIGGTLRTKDTQSASFNQTAFFHWPRRYQTSPVLNTQYPYATDIAADTCAAFSSITNTDDSRYCGESTSPINLRAELNILESWVFKNGDSNNNQIIDILEVEIATASNPIIEIPCYAEPGGTFRTITGNSLISLGIYLHSLADSYSHQACMEINQVRNHDETTDESRRTQAIQCEALDWHIDEEFGSLSDDNATLDLGVAYTKVSSQAIWQALNHFNATQSYHNNKIATVTDIEAFIKTFAEQDDALKRSCIAAAYYEQISVYGDLRFTSATTDVCNAIR